MEVLRVEGLSKIYGYHTLQVKALDGVSFSVKAGEFVSIVGPSGSGKSTLLHILGGVDRPSNGSVYVNGKDIFQLTEDQLAKFRRREVGLIYQFYNLIPVLNISENIALPILLDGREPDQAYLDEIISTLNLTNRVNHLPNQLSGGEQQRVSIGRAIINQPTLLLADEPTGNLNSKASAEIMQLLRFANKKYQQTVIMITHDQQLAKHASRIITLADGKIISDKQVQK